jgi:GH25 family lysozyme M1 (1,4-beta-N-acetylmuramidase)
MCLLPCRYRLVDCFLVAGLFLLPISAVRGQQRDFGVDVSHFQGESGISQPSWNQMYAEGKRFAFIKSTEGLTGPDDAAMANNMNRAIAAGLRAGVYHFAHPENRPTPAGGVQEADHLLTYAGNFIGPGYLRPVLDLEFAAANLSTTALTDWVIAFANEIIAHRGPGAAPIIYCDQFFANNELDARLANYDLWLRTVGGVDPNTEPPPTGSFTNATGVFATWSFWQYSASGSSGGISPLDLNVCHNEFRTLDQYLIPAVTNPVAPTIAIQPQNWTATPGGNAAFSVTPALSSSPPLMFQWRFNGSNIAGATNSAYVRTDAQLADAGNYTVMITNVAGSITSAVAVLTVFTPIALYEETFDGYLAPSTITQPTTTNGFKVFFNAPSGNFDFTAIFGYDYSAVTFPTSIPSAPHSSGGTKKGLYLTVNKDATAEVAAVNLYSLSQNFVGNFALKFDMWISWAGSSGTTEHAMFGLNHSGNVTNRIGLPTSDGLFFAVDGDGGVNSTSLTQRDFAVYQGAGTGSIPILKTTGFGPAPLLGQQFDNANSGFVALFPAKTFSFTTPNGSAGLGWVSGEVRQETNLITWVLNDVIVAQYTNGTGYTNGTILIGYSDNSLSIGGLSNYVIFDNIRVETVSSDSDADGLADAWEVQYFGSIGATPQLDFDGDGASNLAEYFAGTNPTNAASAFRFTGALWSNDSIRLDWTTVGGRSYAVQFAANLTGSPTNFADLSSVIAVSGSTEGVTNYLHVGGATNSAGYYRVRLVP